MNWKQVKLGDVLDYEQPTKYIVETTEYNDLFEIPVLTAGKSFILGYTNEKEGIFADIPVIIFDDFTTAIKFVDFPFKVKSSAMKILKVKKDIADIKFIFYRMSNISIAHDEHKRYWISKYSQIQIPLPPLETQKKIAAILDAADLTRQLTKALIAKYEQLAQSLFLDMFGDPVRNEKGWEKKVLEDICGVGSSRRVFVEELVNCGVPFYRGTEIGQLGAGESINPSLFITSEHYDYLKSQTGVPKVGDLLMPSICPDGRIFRVENEEPFYFKDGRVLWIKVNELITNSIYLRAVLKVNFLLNYASIASGTTFAELKIVALKKIELLFPPLKLQNQFADRIQLIEAQKQQAQSSLQKAEELFNSLLQRAFKGELG